MTAQETGHGITIHAYWTKIMSLMVAPLTWPVTSRLLQLFPRKPLCPRKPLPRGRGAGRQPQPPLHRAAQQQAALNKMLATHARDLSRGVEATTLFNLGKQI